MNDDGKVLTLDEVAARFRVSRSTIYHLLSERKIPAFKIGSDWRFNVESLEQWEQERTLK